MAIATHISKIILHGRKKLTILRKPSIHLFLVMYFSCTCGAFPGAFNQRLLSGTRKHHSSGSLSCQIIIPGSHNRGFSLMQIYVCIF